MGENLGKSMDTVNAGMVNGGSTEEDLSLYTLVKLISKNLKSKTMIRANAIPELISYIIQ